MTAAHQLARVLASKTADGFRLTFETDPGQVFKVVATEEQADGLVEELEELLGRDDSAA
jgi:hypothetical protein